MVEVYKKDDLARFECVSIVQLHCIVTDQITSRPLSRVNTRVVLYPIMKMETIQYLHMAIKAVFANSCTEDDHVPKSIQ